MGKKGPSRHLKREMSPKFWPIHRKEAVWSVRSTPGPHPAEVSTPLIVVIRDVLGFAETAREASMIIRKGKVCVDGKSRKDDRFPVGFMDILELPDADQRYRILPGHGGRVIFHNISKEEASFKLCRIVNKLNVKKGSTQLTFHDGRTIILTENSDSYEVNDTVKLNIPEQEITDHIAFKPGVRAIITGGRSQGQHGILMGLGSEPGNKRTATIRTPQNDDVRTLASYVFAVGTEKPIISLPGVN